MKNASGKCLALVALALVFGACVAGGPETEEVVDTDLGETPEGDLIDMIDLPQGDVIPAERCVKLVDAGCCSCEPIEDCDIWGCQPSGECEIKGCCGGGNEVCIGEIIPWQW